MHIRDRGPYHLRRSIAICGCHCRCPGCANQLLISGLNLHMMANTSCITHTCKQIVAISWESERWLKNRRPDFVSHQRMMMSCHQVKDAPQWPIPLKKWCKQVFKYQIDQNQCLGDLEKGCVRIYNRWFKQTSPLSVGD